MSETIKQAMDRDMAQARLIQFAQSIFHHALERYIAPANHQDVIEELCKFLDRAEVRIVSRDELTELRKIRDEISLSNRFDLLKALTLPHKD